MIRFVFAFTSLLYSFACLGQEWITTQLSDRVKIDFPSQPEIQYFGTIKMYAVAGEDYVINAAVNLMPPNVKFDPKTDDLAGFYKSFINGKLAAAVNSKLVSEKVIDIFNIDAREIIYTKDFNGITGITITTRVVVIDRALILFEVWDLTAEGQEKLTKRFFESFKVNPL